MALTKVTGAGVGTLAGDTTTLTLEDTSSHSANTGPAISFKSKDSGETTREVAKIVGESHSGSNEGNLAFQTLNGGTLETKWKIFKNGNMLPSNSAYGIYLGTTSAAEANLLDDYEEGNWTPVYGGSSVAPTVTYVTQKGSYVKVGDLVHVQGRIRTDTTSGGSGTLRVTGFPFANINQSGHYSTLHIGYSLGWAADKYPTSGLINSNTSHVTLYLARNSDARDGVGITLSPSNLTTGTNNNDIIFSMTYRTD